ncbi:phytanoyl-CoA dioxygenase family protein [Fulvivirga sp. 29W222]|uniref:Phytanoyl-CoA dioxygenase family protein n=1 Tax=Fulvivirga marina TaxID=2494733 RepID=A0A937FYK9_9BACT|nr:phytanoyl-CoA dioxygenase family protein [Fulvivirga marina]MBL6448539.1 phytanoyl-CoA dioxygenase family protein [Fulvivirga marina]
MSQKYDISPLQKHSFLKQGFVLLPKAIPANLLKQWQHLTDELYQHATSIHRDEQLQDMHIIESLGKNILTRCNNILGIYPDAVLDLLSSPAMLAIVEELCGPDVVPLSCDVLYKHPCKDSVIPWHQDALHNRRFPYLNIGVYLDDAEEGDGCLSYVPGTQSKAQDICEMIRNHGWDIPEVVEQPAKAGDILIQDMMVLHGSQAKIKHGARRTIYIEMRPFEAIIDQGFQSREWAELRKRWMGLVKRRAMNNVNDNSLGLGTDVDEIAAILGKPESPLPAVYCYKQQLLTK